MSEQGQENDPVGEGFGIRTPWGNFSAKGLLGIIGFTFIFLVAAVVAGPVVGYKFHREEIEKISEYYEKMLKLQAEAHTKQLESVLRSVREQTIATRYQSCITAIPEKQRWAELQKGGYCDQMARQGLISP